MTVTLTPIETWAEQIGKSPRWVRDHIRKGEILAIRIGNSYFLSDELIAEMSKRAIPEPPAPTPAPEPTPAQEWGQVTRSAS